MGTVPNFSTKASSSSNQLFHGKASTSVGHGKDEGGECGIRLPKKCVARLVQLTDELGFDDNGQTVEWLLNTVEPSIVAATGRSVSSINTPSTQAPAPSTQATEDMEENATVSLEDKDLVKKKRANAGQPLPLPYDDFMRLVTNYDLEFSANDVAVDVGIPAHEENNNQDGQERLG
uniref:transcription factor TCP9-like n=1 Tax=Fragaria vesca subsp. vesca TaxID=101020 RepID=UPI0005C9E734|nr:PREDICTED: transcription factor TCP9-like [Fragaria vesca subsp. vesca]